MVYKGSEWRKWDLHVHTPISIEQEYGGDKEEIWKTYVTELENLSNPYSVIGVNDYFTIEGYKKLANFQEAGRLEKITLFPVVEFRIRAFGNLGKDDPWKRVNLHVIFDNNNINDIETQFLNQLKFDYEDYTKVGLTIDNIVELGKSIIKKTPNDKKNANKPLKVGFNNLNFSYRDICELLKKSGLKYLIVLGKSEWETLRWDGSSAEKKNIIAKSHLMFTASENIKAWKKSAENLSKQGVFIPLLDCSDAHCFSDKKDKNKNLIKDRLGNCNTWIKADETFEGLKQILYESSHRIFIGNQPPIPPPRRIDKLNITFSEDTYIGRKSSDKKSLFCFRGDQEVNFSPYFTCLIGGRGSGKSTVLNLLAKTLRGENSFFSSNELFTKETDGGFSKIAEIENFVQVEGTPQIEYISQNEVEAFAENKEELTNAIYERIVQNPTDNLNFDFETTRLSIEENISIINSHIKDIQDRDTKQKFLKHSQTTLQSDKKIVASSQDPKYSELTKEINKIGVEIEGIKSSKINYKKLTETLKELIQKYSIAQNSPNLIDEKIQLIVDSLNNALSNKFDEDTVDKKLAELSKAQSNLSGKLEEYLKDQGLSQENINDYERAIKAIPTLESTVVDLNTELKELNSSISKFTKSKISSFHQKRKDLESLIEQNLIPLNKKLKSSNVNVKDISFKYEFDYSKAKDAIFEEFSNYFESKNPKSFKLNTTVDAIKRYLFANDPKEVVDKSKDDFLKEYTTTNPSQAEQYILKLFNSDLNYEIYQFIILRNLINPISFKWITGFYDSKELQDCSFGQRCTAVIVALLSFGNKPLIIDEPEAHLDSKLIAEYLVDLVKNRKQERQIIFATHNANFVVNGDAELILHLEVNHDNKTIITPISIENTIHREKLLLLEGGEEAFKKRDNRLMKK